MSYALEGSIFVAGALIKWLRDELGLLRTVEESEEFALSVPDTAGVYVVPAFTGLGAPWWNPDARGIVTGLTFGARKEHIVRAALESLAYQSADLISAFENDSGISIKSLKVDGGVATNGFLMQFMSDILGTPIIRPDNPEATSLGAAFLAGLFCGFWRDQEELLALDLPAQSFLPGQINNQIDSQLLMAGWHRALARCVFH